MSRELSALKAAWGWSGVDFADVLAHSLMGHVLATDTKGQVHYVDPEMGTVTLLGDDDAARAHMAQPEVQIVWRAEKLVKAAVQRLGPPAIGEVFSLNPQALVAGDYAPENLIKTDFVRLIYLAGDIARQTHDLPDGAAITLKVTN